MERLMCKGKIHRATVTKADLHYTGSVTIDADLMRAAAILPYEVVQVTGYRNAARWKTYAVPAAPGSGTVCLNGPPANLFQPGDQVIILSMGQFTEEEIGRLVSRVVFVDERNRIVRVEEKPIFRNGDVNWHGLQME